MKVIEKILLVICFLVVENHSFSQLLRQDHFKFYDYSAIISDLNEKGKKSKYFENLDYEAMLFLDTSSYSVLKKVNPNFLKEKNIDTANIFYEVPEKYVHEVPVKFTDIKQLFSTNATWKNTILQLNSVNRMNKANMVVDNEIYTKDDQKAIFTLWVGSWSITYRVILLRNKLRFEELYQTLV